MDALDRSRRPTRRWTGFTLMLAVPLFAIGAPAQPVTASSTANTSAHAMKTYVILFRQGRPLTDAEKQRRAEETAVWARQQNAAGHKLEPRILAPESEHRAAQGVDAEAAPTETWPVTALLFLEARDLKAAVAVAESHPAIRYGANIEVRPWAAPTPAALAPAAAAAPR